jgi:transcriptional regulator with XRE-family HTH domain
MSKERNTESRDEVLLAFQQACERPTAAQIIGWCQRFPQFAEDIRDHAAIAWDMAEREALPAPSVDPSMLERGFSQVLHLMHVAESSAVPQASPAPAQTAESAPTFQQLMKARGTDVPKLARELDIERGVLADLLSGRMLPPISNRFVLALTSALNAKAEAFAAALRSALNSPRLGHAKADETPVVVPRSYESIIRDSSMTPERKQYWLDEE